VLASLARTGEFVHLSCAEDEAEHSIEMQLPFIAHALRRAAHQHMASASAVRIVPIVVGSLSRAGEHRVGAMLAPYLRDPASFFVVSSDFCHWGSDFDYQPMPPPARAKSQDISAFIARLDGQGMELVRRRDSDGWAKYLRQSGNTICGQHAISILMHAMDCVDAASSCARGGEGSGKWEVRWLAYTQSMRAQCMTDSSVSYASGVIETSFA